jgi:hypothetical protein
VEEEEDMEEDKEEKEEKKEKKKKKEEGNLNWNPSTTIQTHLKSTQI